MKNFMNLLLGGNRWKYALGLTASIALFALEQKFQLLTSRNQKPVEENQPNTVDVSSLSNLNDFTTLNLNLDIRVNFQDEILEGSVEYLIKALRPEVQALNFDVKNVEVIRVVYNENQLIPVLIKKNHLELALGNQLYVYLPQPLRENEETRLIIFFKTKQTKESTTALNWLTPEQTKGKKLPFVFTQCQAILCRTLFPCQDSPSVKSTYEAKITVPSGFAAFCSAKLIRSEQTTEENKFYFKQEIPIPSYLFALVAGDLVEQQVSERTYVIAEPEHINACKEEFSNMENQLKTLENMITPYEWGVYKIVVLPPSFPYGGMENPLLTFISPTCVVGDKSQNAVIVHEMAHSWSGNLVSCKNWNSFWLNEGWTTFFENQACRVLFGEEYYQITTAIEAQEMKEAIEDFMKDPNEQLKKFSTLDPSLQDINPDDVFSTIPYVRGCQFLSVLQTNMGERLFRSFSKAYVNKFKNKSLDTLEFVKFLKDFIIKNDPSQEGKVDVFLDNVINIKGWINTPGQPPNNFSFDKKFILKAQHLATQFIENPENYYADHENDNFGMLNNSLKIIFLNSLIDNHDKLNLSQLSRFHQDYDMKNSQNPEVNTKYFILCIKLKFEEILPQVRVHLSAIGRMKYIRPIYKNLESKGYHDWAEEVFIANQNFYHSVASDTIRIDLNIRN